MDGFVMPSTTVFVSDFALAPLDSLTHSCKLAQGLGPWVWLGTRIEVQLSDLYEVSWLPGRDCLRRPCMFSAPSVGEAEVTVVVSSLSPQNEINSAIHKGATTRARVSELHTCAVKICNSCFYDVATSSSFTCSSSQANDTLYSHIK